MGFAAQALFVFFLGAAGHGAGLPSLEPSCTAAEQQVSEVAHQGAIEVAAQQASEAAGQEVQEESREDELLAKRREQLTDLEPSKTNRVGSAAYLEV